MGRVIDMIEIQNRGKNLWELDTRMPVYGTAGRFQILEDRKLFSPPTGLGGANRYAFVTKVKPNTSYRFTYIWEGNGSKLSTIFSNPIFKTNGYDVLGGEASISFYSALVEDNKTKIEFTTLPNTKEIAIIFDSFNSSKPIFLYNIMMIEGTELPLEYIPPLNKKLQLNTELFGYAGVFDEYLGDGKVLRRWRRADLSQLTLNNVINQDGYTNTYYITVKKEFLEGLNTNSSNYGNIVLTDDGKFLLEKVDLSLDEEHHYRWSLGIIFFINKSTIDAEPGSTISEKFVNYLKKMTIIYQLATPVVEDIQPSGELNLYPGDNYIIGPDYGIISIEGDKKYLYG